MTRHRRKEFTTKTQREARKRSGDRCESRLVPFLVQLGIDCRQELTAGNCFLEHVTQDYLSSDNSLSNCACLCRRCFKLKTSQCDAPVIARVKRVADHHRGIRDPWRKKLPGGRFDSIKLKMNGQVVSRATGQPWRPQ